jgi:hypothetical protein
MATGWGAYRRRQVLLVRTRPTGGRLVGFRLRPASGHSRRLGKHADLTLFLAVALSPGTTGPRCSEKVFREPELFRVESRLEPEASTS